MAKDLDKEFDEELDLEQAFDSEDDLDQTPLPEVSQMEALGIGAGEGLLFGGSDELSGMQGVVMEALASPEQVPGFLGGPIEEATEPQTPEPRQKLLDVYKEYRDAARRRQEAAMEQHPGTTMAGNIAGGFLVPAGMFKAASALPAGLKAARAAKAAGEGAVMADRAKRAMQLKKAVEAAKIGATGGAIAGAGVSEAELTDAFSEPAVLGEFGADVAAGTALGGALGPTVVAGLGAAKSGVEGAKSLSKLIKETDAVQNMVASFRRTLEGQKLLGRAGREEATGVLKEWVKDTLPKIKEMKTGLSDNIQKAISEAEESGQTVDLTDTLGTMKTNLQELTTYGDPKLTKDANDLIKVIDNYLLGPEQTVMQKVKTPAEKAAEKLLKKRAQTRLAVEGDEPLTAAQQRLLKKRAQLEARAPDENIPEFESPEIYETTEGQRVLRQRELPNEGALDPETAELIKRGEIDLTPEEAAMGATEAGGLPRTITQIIDDPNLTPIDVVTDEATGMKFLQYRDLGTGKIHQEHLPDTDEFFKAYKPVKVRGEATPEMGPERAQKLKRILQARTPIAEPGIEPQVQDVALQGVNKIQKTVQEINENVSTAEGAYSNMLKALKILGIEKNPTVVEAFKNINQRIHQMGEDTASGTMHKEIFSEFIQTLRKASPEFADQIEERMLDLAERMDLAFLRSDPAIVAGKSGATIRTGVAGYPVIAGVAGAKTHEVIKNITARLVDMDKQALNGLGLKLAQSADANLRKIGETFMKMSEKDRRIRQSLMFGLMQDDANRRKIKELSADIQSLSESE